MAHGFWPKQNPTYSKCFSRANDGAEIPRVLNAYSPNHRKLLRGIFEKVLQVGCLQFHQGSHTLRRFCRHGTGKHLIGQQ